MVPNEWGVGSWGILSDEWWKIKKKKKKTKQAISLWIWIEECTSVVIYVIFIHYNM